MENIEYLKKQLSIILSFFQSQRFDDVIEKGTLLIKKFPNQTIFYNITSLAYNALGEKDQANKLLLKALKIEPNNFNILNNLGMVSARSGKDYMAEEYYKRALNIKPDFLDTLVNFGALKMSQNQNEAAKKFFSAALKIDNKNITAKLSLASYYEQLGNFDQAKKLYYEILANHPQVTEADKRISSIHKYKLGDTHLKKMEEQLIKELGEDNKKKLNFALGKAYEDIGDHKKSFLYYETANKIFKNSINYNVEKDIEQFEEIKKRFKDNKVSALENNGQKLVFIVGMPRSGTTLTEQILSSHKDVYGAGELSYLSNSIKERFFNKENMLEKNNYTLEPVLLKNMQEEYLEKIKIFNSKEKYFIDKAPLNFKWIGFIMLLFPDAKIIHCKRNPMDTCWSSYKNYFASSLMNYTYDFDDLASYYKIYDNLMNFWTKKFGKKIYNLFYEELIANKEFEIKKLVSFCDLDWDKECLNFHKNKKSVSTVSLAQVRQPLYNSSVDKWKSYSSQLENLKKKLIS